MLCALLHELAEELKLSTHHVTLALMPWQAAGSTSASRCTLTKVQPLFMPQGLEGRALLPWKQVGICRVCSAASHEV